ncbi:hypothetical protein AGMMS4956_05610 [Bacteroidia bacterium]|nr:hypothetical protein AGMMS4956_05610 [Bacteroidia bacterium]
MATLFSKIEKNVEIHTGLPIDKVRWYSPSELRYHLENKTHRKMTFSIEFPAIGRGNVLRNRIVSSEEINRDVDKILA